MKPIKWSDDKVIILDQTRLPHEEIYLEFSDYKGVASAIKEMKIRGAPAIGVATGYGIALGARQINANNKEEFLNKLEPILELFSSVRPTAVNLFKAVERMKAAADKSYDVIQLKEDMLSEASNIHNDEEEYTRQISQHGINLIQDNFTIMTHCNTGTLATAGYGTALGIIKAAYEAKQGIHVYATETRPLLQGARLTTWELIKANIPVTLISDSMVGYFMNLGQIDCVIVGADRIAANGDTANKIGTYTLAVLAMENSVPFYVAAPSSTIDLSIQSSTKIPIEERDAAEVTHIQGTSIAPEGVTAANPSFDITPHRYISAIITEKGILREPYKSELSKMVVAGL